MREVTKQEFYDALAKERDQLQKENQRLRGLIADFCLESAWAAESWKRLPHIKPLFDEVLGKEEQG
jgi:hypothetical protein